MRTERSAWSYNNLGHGKATVKKFNPNFYYPQKVQNAAQPKVSTAPNVSKMSQVLYPANRTDIFKGKSQARKYSTLNSESLYLSKLDNNYKSVICTRCATKSFSASAIHRPSSTYLFLSQLALKFSLKGSYLRRLYVFQEKKIENTINLNLISRLWINEFLIKNTPKYSVKRGVRNVTNVALPNEGPEGTEREVTCKYKYLSSYNKYLLPGALNTDGTADFYKLTNSNLCVRLKSK
jgi:hypothetical protein